MKAAVFLGGGRITAALIAGLRLGGYASPIIVHDRNSHKLRELRKQFRIIPERDLMTAVTQASLLIVAVRPGDVGGMLDELKRSRSPRISMDNKRALSGCSLAAGIPLAKLRARLPIRWVRAMPSPVARAGRGLTAVAFDRHCPPGVRRQVKDFFARVGAVIEVPERKFDAFTVIYSASHGYHALAALAKAAQSLGLDRKSAYIAAAHALADGITSWREGKEPLDALLREAATPGGIAATVMSTMDKAGYSSIVERALRAGATRARKNAKL